MLELDRRFRETISKSSSVALVPHDIPCRISFSSPARLDSSLMWTSTGDHLLPSCCRCLCIRPIRWPTSTRVLTRTSPPHYLNSNRPRLLMASLPTREILHVPQDLRKHLSSEVEEEEESKWVHFHRLSNGATGLMLGIALLLSGGELGYACPSAAAAALSAETVAVEDRKNPQNSELEAPGSCQQRSSELEPNLKQAPDLGKLHHVKYHLGSSTGREVHSGTFLRSRKGALSSHPEAKALLTGRRGEVHEGFGESLATSYGQILQGRDDMAERSSMFTKDAWVGMNRLKEYSELVDRLETQEKFCTDCTRNRRLLEQVWQTVSNEYYDQYGSFSQSKWSGELYDSLSKAGGLLRSRAQTYSAIKEMVASLGDSYSAFLSPDQYRLAIRRPIPSEIKYLAFQYTGVGIQLGKRSPKGGLTVVAPFAGSPAEEAGIIAGERLLRVDGIPIDALSADEAVALLRGPIGSTVELELSSVLPGSPDRAVLVERRALPLPPLRMRMVDVGHGRVLAYLRLHYFTHEATKNMAAAIREGEALGVDGYILDVRNNPGGVFEEAIAMAALWLDCNGCDVTETVRSSDFDVEDLVYSVNNLPKEIFKRHPGTLTHAPLVIITNRSSASASEVLTGALHDNKRAITIGEKTFGKGVVQYFFPMDDGSGLKLTVAKYLTPSRYDISKQGGLAPDTACNDYPHERGQSDKCIEEAVAMLATVQEERPSAPLPAPMPYRWLPFSARRLWASGSY